MEPIPSSQYGKASPDLAGMSLRERQLAGSPIPRLVINYAVPSIIGMLVGALYNVVDRFWIGQLNNVDAMSGIGLTLPLSTIILAFMLLIGAGSAAIISIRLGQQRKPDAEQILANCFSLSIVAGLVLTAAGLIFLRPTLIAFGASENTLPYASSYMKIILYGTVFNTIGFTMNTSIRGSGNPRRSASTQLLGAVLNIFLDPLFIFVFHTGVQGAAIATIISQFISTVWVMSYFTGRKGLIHLRMSLLPLKMFVIRQIFSIGMSPFALQIAASLVTVFANRALQQYGGDIAIGAMTVINSVAVLCMMPLFGINQGLQPILGFNFGAARYERVRAAWRFGVLLGTGYALVCFVAIQAFPSAIISLFIRDPALNQLGTFGIRVFLAMLPVVGFQVISTNFFQSIGRAKIALVTSLLRQVIILLPLYLILPVLFGINGIWFAGPTADFFSFLITATLMIREFKLLRRMEESRAELSLTNSRPAVGSEPAGELTDGCEPS